jgi:hypothetical protein
MTLTSTPRRHPRQPGCERRTRSHSHPHPASSPSSPAFLPACLWQPPPTHTHTMLSSAVSLSLSIYLSIYLSISLSLSLLHPPPHRETTSPRPLSRRPASLRRSGACRPRSVLVRCYVVVRQRVWGVRCRVLTALLSLRRAFSHAMRTASILLHVQVPKNEHTRPPRVPPPPFQLHIPITHIPSTPAITHQSTHTRIHTHRTLFVPCTFP